MHRHCLCTEKLSCTDGYWKLHMRHDSADSSRLQAAGALTIDVQMWRELEWAVRHHPPPNSTDSNALMRSLQNSGRQLSPHVDHMTHWVHKLPVLPVMLMDLDHFDNPYCCVKIRPNILSYADEICIDQSVTLLPKHGQSQLQFSPHDLPCFL